VSLHKVIFLGLSVVGPEEESRLLSGLQKKFNLSPERAERLLQKVPVVVKKGVSKDEMERYVNAFQEIGGRVRVEEEMVAETQEIFKATEPEKKPSTGKMITCPQCRFEQPETNECVKCGIIISKYRQYKEMAQSYEGKIREVPAEEIEIPWESGEGLIGGFIQTSKEALFSPTSFFKRLGTGEGYWPPLIYGIIAGIIGFGVALFWIWLFAAQFIPIEQLIPVEYTSYILSLLIPLPFQFALSILISSLMIHLCLMIVRGNKKGFQMTFRAICYSWSGYLFGMIPFIGIPIGGIYALILTIIGIREGHGVSTGRAVLAIFLPFIVAGVGILLAIIIALSLGIWKLSGGVGV